MKTALYYSYVIDMGVSSSVWYKVLWRDIYQRTTQHIVVAAMLPAFVRFVLLEYRLSWLASLGWGGFTLGLQANVMKIPRLGDERFLSYPFQLIIHQSSYHFSYVVYILTVLQNIPQNIPISTYLPTYLPTYVPTYLWLYSPCGHWPLFQFLNLYTVGRTPWSGDQPDARPLPTHRTTQTE
jgi:hypothetical protein